MFANMRVGRAVSLCFLMEETIIVFYALNSKTVSRPASPTAETPKNQGTLERFLAARKRGTRNNIPYISATWTCDNLGILFGDLIIYYLRATSKRLDRLKA